MAKPRYSNAYTCSDPVVGAILSGWRYDISNISREMRTDYEDHLTDCAHCQRRQRVARTIDVLLMAVSSLSIVAFLLAFVVMNRLEAVHRVEGLHRLEALAGIESIHVQLHHTTVAISLEWVAIVGLVLSVVMWTLVAIATPLPGLLSGAVRQKLPSELRERWAERWSRHA